MLHYKYDMGFYMLKNIPKQVNLTKGTISFILRRYADQEPCKPYARTMKVEECTQSNKRSTVQTPKNPCGSGTHMMDNCPEPVLKAHCTHAPRNLVLIGGLSVLGLSIYSLLFIAGFYELLIRPNVDYAQIDGNIKEDSDSDE